MNRKYLLIVLLPFLAATFALAATTTLTYKTKSGDTLQSVATANSTTTSALAALNPSIALLVGQTLVVGFSASAEPPPPPPPPTTGEVYWNAYTTGYTYWDNTPPGSADIAFPVIHQKAGGTGTFADPITIAVGHSISGGKDTPDFAAGTKFYIPNVQRYFIVEDACGDGNKPQNGPCHVGYPKGTNVWLDMWLGGASLSKSAANACAEKLTDSNGVMHTAIQNPAANYKVTTGEVSASGCGQYGNTVQTQ